MFSILGSFRLFRILDIFGEFVNAWRASCSPPAPGHAAIHVLQLFARKLCPPLYFSFFFVHICYFLIFIFLIFTCPFTCASNFLQEIPPPLPLPPPPQFLNVDSSSSPPLRYRTATGRQCQILDEAPKQGQML